MGAFSQTMSDKQMLPGVLPTRMVLTSLKTKRTGAKKGHQLLKSKADALQVRFRAMLAKIMDAKEAMGSVMSDAFFSKTEAQYLAGDLKPCTGEGQQSWSQGEDQTREHCWCEASCFRDLQRVRQRR